MCRSAGWLASLGLLCAMSAWASDGPEVACDPVRGLEASLFPPGAVVLFGEIHGTEEAPELFADVVCAALIEGRDVQVALEWSPEHRAAIQAYLESDGSDEAREALYDTDPWRRDYQDGRTSRAMLELLEEIRVWSRAGFPVDVVGFDQRPAEGSDVTRDALMARRLAKLVQEHPSAVFLVLTGNIHARLAPGVPWDDDFEPMGYLLARAVPERSIRSLDLSSTGGSAWICQGMDASSCGAQKLGGSGEGDAPYVQLDDDETDGFSGIYYVGSMTASPPAQDFQPGASDVPSPDPSNPPM